jgi:hypothetical protein
MAHMRAMAQGDAVPPQLEGLAQPHVDSFDFFLNEGMQQVVENIEAMEASWESLCARLALCGNWLALDQPNP